MIIKISLSLIRYRKKTVYERATQMTSHILIYIHCATCRRLFICWTNELVSEVVVTNQQFAVSYFVIRVFFSCSLDKYISVNCVLWVIIFTAIATATVITAAVTTAAITSISRSSTATYYIYSLYYIHYAWYYILYS